VTAPTGPVSVEAWVEPRDASARNIFEDGATAQLSISGGKFVFRHDANAAAVTSTTSVAAGTRYHVAGTWDGTTESIYVNGTLEPSATPAPAGTGTSAAPTVYIDYGRDSSAAFHGVIDEVALYAKELSADDIAARLATGTVTEQQYTYAAPPTPRRRPTSTSERRRRSSSSRWR
jgi:hypothetical protein